MLAGLELPGRGGGDTTPSCTPQLADMGIEKTQSHRWQLEAISAEPSYVNKNI